MYPSVRVLLLALLAKGCLAPDETLTPVSVFESGGMQTHEGQDYSGYESSAELTASDRAFSTDSAVGGETSQAVSEGQQDAGDNEASAQDLLALAKRSLDEDASRNKTLLEVCEALQKLSYMQEANSYNSTLSAFFAIFDRILLLAPSRSPSCSPLVSVPGIFDRLNAYLPSATPGILIVEKFPSGGAFLLKVKPKTYDDFLGYPVYSIDDLSVSSTYSADEFFAYFVYTANTSPTWPLIDIGFPIIRWQCVDAFVVSRSKDVNVITMAANGGLALNSQSVGGSAMGTVILRWARTEHTANRKHGCAAWSFSHANWDSTSCLAFESTAVPRNSTCMCEVFPNSVLNSWGFIMYEYEEDLASTIHVDRASVSDAISITGASDFNEYKKGLEDIIVTSGNSSQSYREFVSQLGIVMRFDNVLLAEAFDGTIIKDIGRIMDMVQMEEGKSTIGVRSNDLASVVINLDSHEQDPPIGFGIYKNFSYGLEYFRLNDEMDFNVIFSVTIAYSILFSNSVSNQNSRYAFLLYPPDKFFKPAAFIDGHRVSSMRVLDVVLSPNEGGYEDQFVHMFLGEIIGTNRFSGCAYWSASLGIWTARNCQPSSHLPDGVCSCNMSANFAESRSRGQYIVFTYATAIFVPKSPVDPNEEDLKVRAEMAIFRLHPLANVTIVPMNTGLITEVLVILNAARKHRDLSKGYIRQVIQESRKILHGDYCWSPSIQSFAEFVTVNNKMAFGKLTEFSCSLNSKNCLPVFEIKKSNAVTEYAFRLVSSGNFITYTFLLYPLDVTFHPVSRVAGRKVVSFRVIDLVFFESSAWKFEQHIELYFSHQSFHAIACAFWSEELQDWTDRGCNVVNSNSNDVCTCSLSEIFREDPMGGQYILYSYPTAVFDDDVFEMVSAKTFTNASEILTQGAALVHNASHLLSGSDAELATKLMRIYHKIILLNSGDDPKFQKRLNKILDELEQAFSSFYIDPLLPVSFIYDIATSWSVKNAEVATDLYSNAVLSSDAVGSESTELSDFALAVVGHLYYENADPLLHGVLFSRANGIEGTFFKLKSTTSLFKANPLFACFVACSDLLIHKRFIYSVYPLNLSPYPYSMTDHPMFNTRQVDIYVDGSKEYKKWAKEHPSCDPVVQVYFQPTDYPKRYVKIGCATWNRTGRGWSNDVCTVDTTNLDRIVSCRCNVARRSVTRVMMYEYTELVNFSLVTLYEGPSVVFLIGASFSLFGFIMIVITAILFPAWRDEVGNKVLMHLAASSLLYLCITVYRETHVIFADMKRLDVALVAFTVFVHYIRLVHYGWGLVMSVLQYMKFSSVVGASATSHLLLKVSLLAWGVPLGPLVALLSWDFRTHFCSPDKLTHYILYLVPVVVITLLNLGLLVAIIRNMTNGCGLWDDDELKKHGGSDKDVLMRQLKQMVMMFFLFGIPTVFEMFNDIAAHSVTLDYIDKILNPIQGFVMFLFFVVINDKTRGLWIVHVFGDSVPVNNQPQKKTVFKSKMTKVTNKTKRRVNLPNLSAEAKQLPSAEPEIQIITVGVSDIAVTSVVQKGDSTASYEDPCAAEENSNSGHNETLKGLGNQTPSDIATLDIEFGTTLEDEMLYAGSVLPDQILVQQRVGEFTKVFELLKSDLATGILAGGRRQDQAVSQSIMDRREPLSFDSFMVRLRVAVDELEEKSRERRPQ